ncbi:MAG: TrkH family potassium uptake protein [Pseudomonadota bacterium]
MQLRVVILALGIMTALLGVAMIPCWLLDLADQRSEWPVFAGSATVLILFGIGLTILAGDRPERTGSREAFLLTVLVWVVLPGLAAIPFMGVGMSFTDAMFESVSGLTTTGATVIDDLIDQPRGILLWRAILQWFGGIGIIVTAIAILPVLRVGGMQLFQLESSDVSGKFMPRIGEITAQTGMIYLFLSIACALTYAACGMTAFEAIAHSMTTVAAGGYSTSDASFAAFINTPAPLAAIFFMIIAGLPFSLLALAMLHGRAKPLLTDPQPRLFIGLILGITTLVFVLRIIEDHDYVIISPVAGYIETLFNVVSVITGTGYATTPYDSWGEAAVLVFLVAIFLGGCAGSAACGIKMFRLEISFRAVLAHTQQMISPNRVVPIRYGGRVVDNDTLQSVMVFVFLYLATFVLAAILLSLTGVDPLTAISGAATSVSNVGPGLGSTIGPAGTFESLPDRAKWICLTAMILGRLEFTAVFVLMTRRFWKG